MLVQFWIVLVPAHLPDHMAVQADDRHVHERPIEHRRRIPHHRADTFRTIALIDASAIDMVERHRHWMPQQLAIRAGLFLKLPHFLAVNIRIVAADRQFFVG